MGSLNYKVESATGLPVKPLRAAKTQVLSESRGDVEALVHSTEEPWNAQGTEHRGLHVPQQKTPCASLDTVLPLSHASRSEERATENAGRNLDAHLPVTTGLTSSPSSTVLGEKWARFWDDNKGVLLMVLAQFFAGSMATTARLLQTDKTNGPPMSTFQILFVRMSITMVASLTYMWWAKVPDAPLGKKELRPILVLRGLGGFFGVFGLYYSLIYLPLAEAIVITFLAPLVSPLISSFLIKLPFTRSQQLGGVVSILGVILISKPFSFIASLNSSQRDEYGGTSVSSNGTASTQVSDIIKEVSPAEHAFAVAVGLLGVCGAACAYTTLAYIGKRAHPLISVNYFASWTTLLSFMALLFVPGASFRLPVTAREWILMLFLGVSGFVMQFLLTASLAHQKSNRVLNMVYTQMLFALALDKIIWNESPDLTSWIGSSLILGSAIWVAMKREGEKKDEKVEERRDEEAALVRRLGAEDNERSLLVKGSGRD